MPQSIDQLLKNNNNNNNNKNLYSIALKKKISDRIVKMKQHNQLNIKKRERERERNTGRNIKLLLWGPRDTQYSLIQY